LAGLQALDPLKATIVELRFFAGLTSEEIAGQLGVSPETVAVTGAGRRPGSSQLREPGGPEVERAFSETLQNRLLRRPLLLAKPWT